MEFIVRQLSSRPNTITVRYDCACGCKPNARHMKESQEVNFEHCCCGNVHFVGQGAKQSLESYLSERRAKGEDADVGEYSISETKVETPWGYSVAVAFGQPATPRMEKE